MVLLSADITEPLAQVYGAVTDSDRLATDLVLDTLPLKHGAFSAAISAIGQSLTVNAWWAIADCRKGAGLRRVVSPGMRTHGKTRAVARPKGITGANLQD